MPEDTPHRAGMRSAYLSLLQALQQAGVIRDEQYRRGTHAISLSLISEEVMQTLESRLTTVARTLVD